MRMPPRAAGYGLQLAALLATLPLHATESRELYLRAGTDRTRWEPVLAPLRAAEPELTVTVVEVPDKADSPAAARARAKAMAAGVASLPSLVLRDAQGAYAALPLAGLTVPKLEAARGQTKTPELAAARERRRYEAACYLLCARIAQPGISDEALATAIEECRMLLRHASATETDRQFLGLRCLYPLLMMQYARGYDGAHSPETEAKLLEAIAALEAARDLNRDTPLGKEAFAERERLRMARRKARQYE